MARIVSRPRLYHPPGLSHALMALRKLDIAGIFAPPPCEVCGAPGKCWRVKDDGWAEWWCDRHRPA